MDEVVIVKYNICLSHNVVIISAYTYLVMCKGTQLLGSCLRTLILILKTSSWYVKGKL